MNLKKFVLKIVRVIILMIQLNLKILIVEKEHENILIYDIPIDLFSETRWLYFRIGVVSLVPLRCS